MSVDILVKKMIRRYGRTVKRKARTVADDGSYTYTVSYPVRGQFSQITATDEVFYRFGVALEADYIGTFLSDTEIEIGDLLELQPDEWYEVVTKVTRYTGSKADFIEVLLRRRE